RNIDITTLNPQVITDIAQARLMADIVIVCPHWGIEYATVPSSVQEQFAMQMTEAGADVIIGTHPHVVQPVTWIEAANGNRALCYYSLGNYVSTQKNPKSMLEGLAWITFHVSQYGISISEENTGIVPLVCHYTSGPVRLKNVYLLEDYTEKLAQSHGIIPYGGVAFHLSSLQKWSEEILGNWVLTADQILNQTTQQYCELPE
ncbi:MAG: CapA family protein, partial [Lachnospiraceae bacterium]|nr:CapA family protein [Lachnospiraceae bacterium]